MVHGDKTFKVVHEPYVQLFRIHAFLRSWNNLKQVPLVSVVMSRRQKVDYNAVFKEVVNTLGEPKIEEAVLDFEQATWLGLRNLFHEIEIYGWVFHYTYKAANSDALFEVAHANKNRALRNLESLFWGEILFLASALRASSIRTRREQLSRLEASSWRQTWLIFWNVCAQSPSLRGSAKAAPIVSTVRDSNIWWQFTRNSATRGMVISVVLSRSQSWKRFQEEWYWLIEDLAKWFKRLETTSPHCSLTCILPSETPHARKRSYPSDAWMTLSISCW